MRLIAAAALMMLPAAAHAAQPITGQWLTKEGKAIVTIAACGNEVCGRIVKVLKPDPNGNGHDLRNPDANLRGRPIEGLEILSHMADAGSEWRGRIYSPEQGREYRAVLRRRADGGLDVQGCWGAFCQSQIWTPAR